MTKNEYVNTMPYITDMTHPRSHYKIEGASGFCNMGNLCESIVKHHRGLPYLTNPNIAGLDGYDIPELKIEVKSGESGLGRAIGNLEFSQSEQIRFYFQHKSSDSLWMWVYFNPKTQIVTEYIMNKHEFGRFLHIALRSKQHKQSNGKSINVRFKKTSKKMLTWLDEQVEMAA